MERDLQKKKVFTLFSNQRAARGLNSFSKSGPSCEIIAHPWSNRCFSHYASVFAVLFCLFAFITVFALAFLKLICFFALYVFEVDLFKVGGGCFFCFSYNFPK